MKTSRLHRRHRRHWWYRRLPVAFSLLTLVLFISAVMVNPFSTETHSAPVYELSPIIVPTNLASVLGAGAISSAQLTENKTQGGLPLGIQPWSAEAQAHLSFSDQEDALLPQMEREGEQPITHQEFLTCLAERLNVDVATRTQRALIADETDPLIIFPIMMELSDHRALICNMDITIHYIMYIDNGGLSIVGHFLDDIMKVFGWTGRIAVRRYPENVGCGGALNNGFHWALSLPEDEVPFVHITNHDVRFPPGLLRRCTREMHRLTRNDPARIRELEAEVAKEDADPATWARYKSGRPLRGEWSPNATLVTSRLLPDRIRYMPLVERVKQFSNHTAYLFFNRFTDTSSYFASRLALLTAGYNDEGYFPLYFEDVDYRWRVDLLGFMQSRRERGTPHITHFRRSLLRSVMNVTASSPEVAQLKEFLKHNVKKDAGQQFFKLKWGSERLTQPGAHLRYVEPFMEAESVLVNPPQWRFGFGKMDVQERQKQWSHIHNNYQHLPLDAWVRGHEFLMAARAKMYRRPMVNPLTGGPIEIYYDPRLTDVFARNDSRHD